ncbi:hypothetical protein ACVJGC_005482 [Bradyrhizobium diazoefficiens]
MREAFLTALEAKVSRTAAEDKIIIATGAVDAGELARVLSAIRLARADREQGVAECDGHRP